MLIYPAIVERDGEGFFVRFPDIPEALTQGRTREEALDMAEDALLTAMDFYFGDKRKVPMPSVVKRGQTGIGLPASVSAKVLLLNAMIEQHVTPAELARKLHASPQSVTRLVDLAHASKIDAIADALHAIGRRLTIGIGPSP